MMKLIVAPNTYAYYVGLYFINYTPSSQEFYMYVFL